MDFLINDVAKSSLQQAVNIEHAYDSDRISGFMFCTYKTDTLLDADMTSILDLFELHDQVFVLKESEVYKLHVTKESVHKFFISGEIVYELLVIQKKGPEVPAENLQRIDSMNYISTTQGNN